MATQTERLHKLVQATYEIPYPRFPAKHKWLIDHRENEGLHALYVKYAIAGILAIDKAIKLISDQAKTSHSSLLCAMYDERAKLVLEDSAYWEAYTLLEELSQHALIQKLGDIFCGTHEEAS